MRKTKMVSRRTLGRACAATALAVAVAPSAVAQDATGTTVFVVVRHADRDDGKTQLNDLGNQRAEDLARALADSKIAAVYVSHETRTHQTAKPLVDQLGTKHKAFGSAKELVEDARANHRGKCVLVVGHSEGVQPAVPDVLRELGVASPPTIPQRQFDNLFVCADTNPPTLLRLRYGASTR